MTIEYTFVVESLMCEPIIDNKTNSVSQVNWRFGATNNQDNAIFYGSTHLNYDPSRNFIEYDKLTQENVKNWVETSIGQNGIDEIKANLNNQLQKMQTAKPKETALPWVN